MKIITENSVYVQRKDIGELLRSDMPFPGLTSLLGNLSFSTFIDEINGEEFVRLNEIDERDFIIKQDWILDFDEVKNLNFEELTELWRKTLDKEEDIITKYISLPRKERIELYDETLLTRHLLYHKVRSIDEFSRIKCGLTIINWPNDIEIPKNMITVPSVSNSTANEPKTKSNIFQLIKSRFKKNV